MARSVEGRDTTQEGAPCARSAADRAADHVQLRTYIVEDNATIRENLIGALEELASIESLGWAETENDAKQWLAANGDRWDLAIVDLFLKQGSGLGVLEAARERRSGQHVVVLSNYATPDMRKRCEQLGADAVFDKSNEIDALVEYCTALHHAPQPGA
jgi:DNA-binding NarL/FixJ family response regulator